MSVVPDDHVLVAARKRDRERCPPPGQSAGMSML
jgi:hypothetical protein